MELQQTDPRTFAGLFGRSAHIYNTAEFAELNRGKCDEVAYLVFSDARVRGGLILGRRADVWHNPFSAPYGGLTLMKDRPVQEIEQMWRLAADFAGGELKVVLPPEFMGADAIAKQVNVLTRLNPSAIVADINHHVDLRGVTDCRRLFSYNALGSLKQALRLPLSFEKVEPTPGNIAEVHRVITLNHEHRGYPVHMSAEDITRTAPVVGADFFVLRIDGEPVAAAQVHHPLPRIAQIIYWGDVPGHQNLRPMHRLAYGIFSHYLERGDTGIVDIGISTVDGIPNQGLCFFKESIGCRPVPRFTFRLAAR